MVKLKRKVVDRKYKNEHTSQDMIPQKARIFTNISDCDDEIESMLDYLDNGGKTYTIPEMRALLKSKGNHK